MFLKVLIYFTFAFPLFFFLEKISHKLNLLDVPSKRKGHLNKTSFIGGLGLSIFFLIFIKNNNFSFYIDSLLIYSFILSLIGLIDDKYNLNIGGKLSLQIFVSYLLVEKSSLFLISYIGNFYFLGEIYLGEFSLFVTLVSIIFLINASNYADGCDGNLALQTLSILILIIVFTEAKLPQINELVIYISIVLIVFLLFNLSFFKLPKIFLGDSGSMAIGYFVAFLLIYLSNQYKIHPLKIIWIITYLSHEFVATSLDRFVSKKSIFTAGLDHMHYFLKKNYSNLKTIIILSVYNLFIGIFGFYIFEYFGQNVSAILYIFIFLIHFKFRSKLKNI